MGSAMMLRRASVINIVRMRQAFGRHTGIARTSRVAFSSAVTPEPRTDVDWVRTAVQRLLEPQMVPQQQIQNADVTNSTNYSNLEDSIKRVQSQLEEARLCVADCHECQDEHRQEEIQTADAAIDAAVAALVDLLDGLRHANVEDKGFSAVREETVTRIRKLRNELDSLRKPE